MLRLLGKSECRRKFEKKGIRQRRPCGILKATIRSFVFENHEAFKVFAQILKRRKSKLTISSSTFRKDDSAWYLTINDQFNHYCSFSKR